MDAAACTDEFEDNDQATEAAKIPLGKDVKATIFAGDDDYYELPALASGACSVTYEIPNGRKQQLQIRVYDGAGSLLTDAGSGALNGRVDTVRAAWTEHQVLSVKVTAIERESCQPYTLRCEASTGK